MVTMNTPASEGMGVLYGGALLLALLPPLVLFSGSYEYLWEVTGFVSAAIGFKVIGLITVFVASQYLFKGVTSLFAQGPKTYWPTSGQDCKGTQSVRPQLLNGSILTGLFLATVFAGGLLTLFWSWFANFLAPVLNFPGVTLDEGAVEHGFPFGLWFPLAWQWRDGSMHTQHRFDLNIRSPKQILEAMVCMSYFGIRDILTRYMMPIW